MNPSEIYKKIKAMRILKEWSQEEAASRLGIAVSSYAKIERGETDINLSRLAQIAEMMGVDLSQLLELNGHNVLNVF
jgi:transcriptional regulator with XRE-family HTH domain